MTRTAPLLSVLALAVCVFALYAATSQSRGFVFDDHEVILSQAAPASAADVLQIFRERHIVDLPYYRPATRTTLLVQKSLHGADPWPFHLFNAALMAAIALAAYALLRVPAFGIARAPALVAAALFAVHPLASSCVYPVASGRETALPSLFMLLAVWGWLGERRWIAHGAFVLALLGKEQAAVVPVLFVAADLLAGSDAARRGVRDQGLRYLPTAAILVAYAGLRAALFGGSELRLGDWSGPLWSWTYALQASIAPTRGLVYEPRLETWLSAGRLAIAGAGLAVLAFGAWRTRAPVAFWAAWFAVVQLPTANLLEQEAPFDERYAFLASLGLWAAVAAVVSNAWGSRPVRVATLFCGALAVGLAAGVSASRAGHFADDDAFMTQWYRSDPDSLDANVHLGRVRLAQDRFDEAERLYARAVELNPTSAPAHMGLGQVFDATGRPDAARAEYLRAVRLDPRDSLARFQLARLYEREGARERALEEYARVLRLKPNLSAAHFNRANLLKRAERRDEAIASYRSALRFDPELASAHFNLANTLAEAGRFDEAIGHYREVLRLDAADLKARNNLALALAHAGREAEAEAELRAALELAPGDVATRRNLRWLEQRRAPHEETGTR